VRARLPAQVEELEDVVDAELLSGPSIAMGQAASGAATDVLQIDRGAGRASARAARRARRIEPCHALPHVDRVGVSAAGARA